MQQVLPYGEEAILVHCTTLHAGLLSAVAQQAGGGQVLGACLHHRGELGVPRLGFLRVPRGRRQREGGSARWAQPRLELSWVLVSSLQLSPTVSAAVPGRYRRCCAAILALQPLCPPDL